MQISMEGRKALITGGGRNIGRAMAVAFARAGADVAVIGLSDREALEQTCGLVEKAGRRASMGLFDVADPELCPKMIREQIDKLGGLDCLINNAAVRRHEPFLDLDYGEWRTITATILDGAFLVTQTCLPSLIRSGSGSVLNIGGASAYVGAAERAHVIAAKLGLEGLTRALAVEFAKQVRVNCLVPGQINTERKPGQPIPNLSQSGKPFPIAVGTSEDVAGYALYLSSDLCRYITGQTVHVSGGLVLS